MLCANGDVDGWVRTPVITTSVACVGIWVRVQDQELEQELEILQACEVPRWTQLSSRMVDKRCAGTQVCSAVARGRRSKGIDRGVPGWDAAEDLDEKAGRRSVLMRNLALKTPNSGWISGSGSGSGPGSGSEKEEPVLNLSTTGSFWRRRGRSAQYCGRCDI